MSLDVYFIYDYALLDLLLLVVVCVCAQDSFEYEKSEVDYVVNQPIQDNVPLTKESGAYIITPALSKGLKIDENTGVISGTPEEEYQASYTVRLTRSDDTYLTASIYIKGIISFYIL